MNIPTATDNARPVQPAEGMLRNYEKDIDGVCHMVIDQYQEGKWVQLASVPADTQYDESR